MAGCGCPYSLKGLLRIRSIARDIKLSPVCFCLEMIWKRRFNTKKKEKIRQSPYPIKNGEPDNIVATKVKKVLNLLKLTIFFLLKVFVKFLKKRS